MKISVSGKHLDVGDSLRTHVVDSVEESIKKYFDNAIDADIVFFKEAHNFCADIIVNEGTGQNIVIRAQGKESDVYAAFDKALERISKQLRRYKRRLKNHHKVMDNANIMEGVKYVVSPDLAQDDTGQADDNAPLIIAEKQNNIEVLSVSDAVMRMDLAHLPALMFINKKTGNVDLVYTRADGNISWVESKSAGILSEVA